MIYILFLGNTFLANKYCADPTVIDNFNITSAKLEHGIFDELFISANTNYNLDEKEWGFSVILWTLFNGNLSGGNIVESLKDIQSVLIKRKRKSAYEWITLFEIPVENADSLNFERFDKYVANNVEYEYALVFKLANVEGSYNINSIIPTFNGIFIVSRDKIFSSFIEAYVPQVQRNHPVSVVNTIDSKYPFVISNSKNNYYSGSVNAFFAEQKLNSCEIDFANSYKYRHDLLEFLCDGTVKLLKLDDGRMFMIMVVDNPTEDHEHDTLRFTTSFNWVEIGEAENERDLRNNNLLDIPFYRGI